MEEQKRDEIRLVFVGSAGQGRTNVAKSLSEKLGVLMLPSPVKTILSLQNYDYNSGIPVEKWMAQNGRQFEVLDRRIDLEKKHSSFISDRCCIDIASYILLEQFDKLSDKEIKHYLQICYQQAITYSHILLFPWGKLPLVNNKLRTVNRWYQALVHATQKFLLDYWDLSYYELQEKESDERVEEILEFIKERIT